MKKFFTILLGLAILASVSHAYVFGVDVGGIGGGALPYMGFQLNTEQRVDVGLGYNDFSGGNNALVLMGRFENRIASENKLNLSWAGQLGIGSSSTGGTSTTTINILGLVSAELKITDAVALYGNIYLLNLTSTSVGGSSTTTFGILNGDLTAYSGFRIYI